MATYALYTASYGSNYANLRVRILEQDTGVPAIVMASATSGILSSHGNALLDSSGNLSVFLDNAKTWQVWNNQFILVPNQISIAQEIQRTSAQIGATPTLADIALGPGATFYLDTNPAAQYRISADKTQYSLITGSGGSTTFAALTDKATAPIASTNTSVANALAAKVTNVGTFTSTGALQTAFPAGVNLGNTANVGSSAPYTQYVSSGSAWIPAGGTSSFGSLTGSPSDNSALVAAIPTQALQVHAVPVSGGTYNATTNTPVRTSGVAPADGVQCLTVTVAGVMTIASVPTQLNVGDELYWNGTDYTVVRGVPVTTSILKGDGAGGLAAAVAGTDYAASPLIFQCGVPRVILPTGTMAANGAYTAGTAVQASNGFGYYNEGCWGFCPANMIDGANAAGFYWCVFTSNTAATIYQNKYLPGNNRTTDSNNFYPPGSTTAFSNAYTGTFTAPGTGTAILIEAVTIAANSLGKNGSCTSRANFRETQSATTKTYQTKLGITVTAGIGSGGSAIGLNLAPASNAERYTSGVSTWVNRGRTDRQVGVPNDVYASLTAPGGGSSVDTTAAQVLGLFVTCAATDFAACDSSSHRVEFFA